MMMEVVKSCVLLVSVAIVLAIWGTAGAAGYQSVMSPEVAFTSLSYEGFLDWLSGTWYAFVIFAKIAFWVVVALLGTFIVLLVMIVFGVGSWLIQRVTQGISYLVGVIKGQWTTEEKKTLAQGKIVVAMRMDGSDVTLQEWMSEAHNTINDMNERIKTVEKINGVA